MSIQPSRRRFALPSSWSLIIPIAAMLACAPRAAPTAAPDADIPGGLRPVDAIDAILASLDSTPIVAIGEIHEIEQLGAFRLRLLRDPRLPDRVQDIVIEGGNSLYQALATRFVNGETVGDDSLRLIWNNTTQSPLNTLDVPMYAEDVLRAVRDINSKRRTDARLRVLLADPPLEWNAITTRADLRGKIDRPASQFRVLNDSVLAHGRRALFFCGSVHLHRATAQGRENPAARNVVQRLLAARPRSVYVVEPYSGFGGSAASYNHALDAFAPGSLIRLADSPLGDLLAEQVYAATPETPPGSPDAVRILLSDSVSSQKVFTDVRLGDVVDALLLLGPYSKFALAPAKLDYYRGHPEALAELDRRQMLRMGTHFDTADFFSPSTEQLPFAGGRSNRNVSVPMLRNANADAVRVLARTLAALGGEARLNRLRTVRRQGVRTMSDPTQGYRPVAAGEQVPVLETFTRSVMLDFLATRHSMTMSGEIFGGQAFSSRSVTTPQGGFTVNDLKRTIQNIRAPSGISGPLGSLPRVYPEVLIAQFWAQRDSLRTVPNARGADTRGAVVIAAGGGAGAPQLYVDLATGLPIEQESIVRTPNGVDTTVIEYSDWRPAGGMRFPFTQTQRRNGIIVERFELQSLDVNGAIDESAFARPPDVAPQPAPPPLEPKLVKLGDGVFMVERAYNSLFVVFDDYVLLVEPVMGRPVAQATQRLIEQTAPGKPIRYVVATHFHGDHIGGAPAFLESGSTLVTTPHAAEAVRRVIMRTGGETSRVSATQFEHVSSRRTFSDTHHSVEVFAVGPNPHAEQMLIVYIPKEGLLFEGDMLDIDAAPGRPAIAGRDTDALLREVRRLGLRVSTILPVHGRLGTLADLETAAHSRPTAP